MTQPPDKPPDIRLGLTPEARDSALVWALAELQTLRVLVSALTGAVFHKSDKEIRQKLRDLDRESLSKVFAVLAKHSDIQTDWLQREIERLLREAGPGRESS